MYGNCASVAKIRVSEEVPLGDVVSWNAKIADYVQRGLAEQAFRCFEWMQCEGPSPNAVTYISLLKACGMIAAANKGEQLHEEIVRQGLLGKDNVLHTALVDMYARCGALVKAKGVFDKLLVQDVVTWNALITGYVQQGNYEEALKCLWRMQSKGLSPDAVTFVCLLKACGSLGAVGKGEQLHEEIMRRGLLGRDIVLGTTLIDMYAKCGAITKAARVLDELPIRNTVSWNALIGGYLQNGQNEEALSCFNRMQRECIPPNVVTYTCVLSACGSMKAFDKGKQMHDEIVRHGLLGKDVVLGNALVNMYGKCGAVEVAAGVLKELPIRDSVSWNTLITCYVQQGHGDKALECFEQMRFEGVLPAAVTYVSILRACGTIGAVNKGVVIHGQIVRQGFLKKDIILGTTLVDMYAKCGALDKAAQSLDELCCRSIVSWNALMMGYAQQGQGEDTLRCFERMQLVGLLPNTITFTCVLKACSSIGAVGIGRQIHDKILTQGLLAKDVALGATLVDMYAKCGALSKATDVLEELPIRNVVSWNALIAGYTQQGISEKALECFERMQQEGFIPSAVSLACVLSACSRTRLLDEGQMYFTCMFTNYGMKPDLEHQTSMVDLFSRAGELEQALAMIQMMPFADQLPVWHALISACRECGNVKLGRLAFDNAMQIDGNDASAYVLMTAIHAAGLM